MNEKLTSRYASISLSGDLIEKERQVSLNEGKKEGRKK
jgi:hypothetical protein